MEPHLNDSELEKLRQVYTLGREGYRSTVTRDHSVLLALGLVSQVGGVIYINELGIREVENGRQ